MKKLICFLALVLITLSLVASSSRSVYQKVVCYSPNNVLDYVTNIGITTSANYIVNAWMLERPAEIITTEVGQPGYVTPTYLRMVRLGTAPNQYASIFVNIGSFPTQWEAGNHLQYQVTFIASGEVAQFELEIPTGTGLVNILEPTQNVPPYPEIFSISGSVSWNYNQDIIENVAVNLLDAWGNSMLQSTSTNELGEYVFENLALGSYIIAVEPGSIVVNGNEILTAYYNYPITITGYTTHDFGLDVRVPVVNADGCTFIGYYNGHGYWRSNWSEYWPYMNGDFNNRGGHHITISSEGESHFVNQYIQQDGGNFHLGYEFDGTSWHWIDGSPVGFTNWAPGEPSGDSEVSAIMPTGWVDLSYWSWVLCGIMESNGIMTPLAPKDVTGLNIQQQRDFTVNLSWTNPSEVICGLSLLNGFDIVIKRDGVIVATFTNCTAGAAMNWQDSLPIGQAAYQVYAENSYGAGTAVDYNLLFGNATLSGAVVSSYGNYPLTGLEVKLYNEAKTELLQTVTTNGLGEYAFNSLSYINYCVLVETQTISINAQNISFSAFEQMVEVRADVSLPISLNVFASEVNASSCTYIGYFNGHDYWRSEWGNYWHYMRDDFNNRGGYLVSINSEAESQFITQYITQHPATYLLGLEWNGTSWNWMDGSALTYTNWAPGQPAGDIYCSYLNSSGFWNAVYYWNIAELGIMESRSKLQPKPITELNIQQQRDFTVNLSWTNPAETHCGLNLLNGFDIVIKRDGAVAATLPNCTAGAALNWQDQVLMGRHTYDVLAMNEYGESTPVTQSISYGNQVQGLALLNNVADHSGIKVLFIADPSTPAAVSDSTYTNINGFYSINLTIGRYTIIYSKAGYLDQTYNNYLHDGPFDLPEQTLEYVGTIMYLSGSLSGTLTANYAYIINSQIWVDGANTLLLEPGVRFYFKNGVGFDVNGVLTAIGTAQNPILFTSVTSEIRGEFWLNAHGSVMEHCEFTKGYWALRLNSNSHVSHSKFYGNNIGVGIMDSAGDGCLFDYNEIYGNTEGAMYLYCYGAVIEHNDIYNNQLSGHLLLLQHQGRSIRFESNYVHNNTNQNHIFYLHGRNTIYMENNVIEDNTTSGWILHHYHAYNYPSFIFNNVLRNNSSGDLFSMYGDNGVMEGNTFENNGGSLYISDQNIRVHNNTIIGSTSNGMVISGSNNDITQNTIIGCGGAGMVVHDSSIIRNNIVVYNTGTELVNNSGNPSLHYNLFYDTSGTLLENNGGLPFLLDLQTQNANGTPCDTYWNISTDPLFFDFANNNYNLLPTSPCINAGDPTSPLDPDGTIADLGAYYYDLNASSHAQIAIPLSLYNFQSVPVGTSQVWNCQVRNTGTDPLVISSIQLNNPAFYLATQTRTNIPFSLTIAPSQTGYIPIGFMPSAVADYADTLRINSNALMNPQVSIRLFGAGTTSTSVTMAMPQNTIVNVLSNFTLPVSVSDTTPYNLLSYNMSLTFDPGIFEFLGVETTGTMSENWFVQVNSAGAGVLHIGGAGTNPLAGSGNLFKLNFHTLSGILDGTESYINISQIVFNEGGLSIQGCFATVIIRNIIYGDVDDNLAIQAYDGALALQYSVMMDPMPLVDPRPWVDWRKQRADVSGDGNIFAYDASLILQRVVGIIDSFPAELGRLAAPESTVEISFYHNQLILSSPDYSSLYGLNLTIPNPNGLAFSTVQLADAFQDAMLNQYSIDNTWYLALANITPPQGGGTICIIPLIIETETQLSLTMVVNESSQDYTIDCLPLAQPENPVVSINYLAPNSPNPFNPSTTIYYGLKEPAQVELAIFNLKGQKVKTLVSEAKAAGSHSIVWNGKDDRGTQASTGIYFSRIKIGSNWTKTQKMMLMK